MHWPAEVEPTAAVVPLPQLAQDEPSRKKPTLQMHWPAEVEPTAAVVPLPQLVHMLLSFALLHFPTVE